MIFAEKSQKQRQPLYLASLDLTKALDLVDRTFLFTELAKAGCLQSDQQQPCIHHWGIYTLAWWWEFLHSILIQEQVIVSELLCADDAALCATSAEQLQNLLDCFSSSCDKFGFTISLKKTVTMSQSTKRHHFTINDTTLDDVEKFTYLGSTLSKNTNIESGNGNQTWPSFHNLRTPDKTCLGKLPPEYPH